jgi:hypothetical protein
MIARISGTVILSLIVFVLVALLVTIGVWWWSGGLLPGAMIGVISGFAAAFLVGTVGIAVGRSGGQPRERLSDDNERSSGGSGH